jgi:hypothetical protein
LVENGLQDDAKQEIEGIGQIKNLNTHKLLHTENKDNPTLGHIRIILITPHRFV